MGNLNILVLHRLGDPELAPIFLWRHVFAQKIYCPKHNYIYHDVSLPPPTILQEIQFDAIILDVTFLGIRWAKEETYQELLHTYKFVKDANAVKLAFPQDDYDCHKILDEWMCDWNIDVLFSAVSSHWEILYPRFYLKGEIQLGYTGYIDEALIDMPRLPFKDRQIDIGYRAKKLPPYFGRLGETKWKIGELVAIRAQELGLITDIELGDQGRLLGKVWLDFINNSKFTLGSNTGSSLLDPYGLVQAKVKQYIRTHPAASFTDVEKNCFEGLDEMYYFTAISPRILEAGLLESCQILVEGDYSGLIFPWEHYIPIRRDASDFDDVYRAMQDRALVERLRNNCRTKLLDCRELRASVKAGQVIDLIADLKTRKGVVSDNAVVARATRQYEETMTPLFERHWKQQAVMRKVYRGIKRYRSLDWLADSLRSIYRTARAWKRSA